MLALIALDFVVVVPKSRRHWLPRRRWLTVSFVSRTADGDVVIIATHGRLTVGVPLVLAAICAVVFTFRPDVIVSAIQALTSMAAGWKLIVMA